MIDRPAASKTKDRFAQSRKTKDKRLMTNVKIHSRKLSGWIVLSFFIFHFSFSFAQELLNYPLDTVNGEEMYRYQVEKSIGLYRVGVNFNVSQAEIVRCNPQLRERGLHYGEIILIPTGRPVVIETKPEVVQTVITETVTPVTPTPTAQDTPAVTDTLPARPDTVLVPIDSLRIDSLRIDSLQADSTALDSVVMDTRRVVELALLLPFESQQTKRSGNAERMLEFYQGALMALRELQNDSTLYRLRVYDTGRSERRINILCDTTDLDSVKGILGPVYPIQIERMAAWCEVHQVPLLLPFSDETDLATHPQVMQFNSTDRQEADSLCAWIAKQRNIHCVAVEASGAPSAWVSMLHKQMYAKGISFITVSLRELMTDSVEYAFDLSKENIIILHNDRFQNIRMVLSHLERLQRIGYRIRLVSQYSWQKEDITLPQIYTSMFTKTEGREAYDEQWKATFANEHVSDLPRYDLLGYDLMRALIDRIEGKEESTGLQSDIQWKQIENGGYQNARVKVVVK